MRIRGDFGHVHTFPKLPADVSDEHDARLVVLSSEAPYVSGLENPALALAGQILDSRGAAPRLCRNSLMFLAADRTRRQDLDEALRHFPAWDSIVRDVEKLNLNLQSGGPSEGAASGGGSGGFGEDSGNLSMTAGSGTGVP